MCMYMFGGYVCKYVHVYACMHGSRQRSISVVILKSWLPCVFETRFLTWPGTHLCGWFCWPMSPRSLSPSPQPWNYKHIPPCLDGFLMWDLGQNSGLKRTLPTELSPQPWNFRFLFGMKHHHWLVSMAQAIFVSGIASLTPPRSTLCYDSFPSHMISSFPCQQSQIQHQESKEWELWGLRWHGSSSHTHQQRASSIPRRLPLITPCRSLWVHQGRLLPQTATLWPPDCSGDIGICEFTAEVIAS